ncbi:hypothetical protein JTE90_003660 [Oedothorax gibbosus]|uniref:GRIP domain-containing protein n=1 Tax=Oedothorax gibbosus TaxID=931172 RepID=A0AAV6VTW7_9ARAC|nr:hypothetical protein JTE90_003660 [Oedothorax gibbosus]
MSWLGDQFNSITGKITDFTKVLSDSASDLSEVPGENGIQSSQKLSDLCREKDARIEILLQEKAALESSIEELDQQQQEAINSLLQSKNAVLVENRELKAKLATQATSSHIRFQSCSIPLSMEDLQKSLRSIIGNSSAILDTACSEKNINLLMLLHLFSDSCSDDKLKTQMEWLESQKQTLENDACEDDKDTVNSLIDRINDYVNFLKTVSKDPQSVFPVISEICLAFNFLVSEIVHLSQRFESVQYKDETEKEVDLNVSSQHENELKINDLSQKLTETCDSAIQSLMQDYVNIQKQTEDKSIQHNNLFLSSSKQVQTVDEEQSHTKDNLINELQSKLNDLNQQNAQFQVEIHNLKSLFNKVSASVASQTDDNNVLESNTLKSEVEILQKEKVEFESEIRNLKILLNKNSVAASSQTENNFIDDSETLKSELRACKTFITEMEQKHAISQKEHADALHDLKQKLISKESVLSEKDAIIQSQKKEVLYLKDKIKNIIAETNLLKNREQSNNTTVETPPTTSDLTHIKDAGDLANEIPQLKAKVTNLELEKGKLLCVLNEKSQECSSLKSEVHKLTSIVASEKQALFKLQQDNCELKLSSKEIADPELARDTIRKLSTMIRDKDFEIESLRQKNSTLTTLLQDTGGDPEQMMCVATLQSLVEEKESLSKEVNQYKSDREKFMASYNSKDKECRRLASEVKELSSSLSKKTEAFDVLEQKHLAMAQQYEEKQKSLIHAQNEIVAMRQRMAELDQQQATAEERYSDLLKKIDGEATVQITKEELQDKDARLERLTCSTEEKERLIEEKDRMIHDLSQQVKKVKADLDQKEKLMHTLEVKVKDSMDKVAEARNDSEQLEERRRTAEQKLDDKASECALLKDMNERLNMALREKEFAMQSMTEKISSLSQYISSDRSESEAVDVNQILADSESMFSKAQSLYRERDETLLALNQSKQENQSLRNEMQRMKSNEIHLTKELERLRQHLIEAKEIYTNEALASEEKEKRLQDELVEARRRTEITNSAVVDTNQRASVQISSLQEQLSMIVGQRDAALAQISSLEDQVQHQSTAVGKLQLVLEQMQKSNDRKLKEVENKWQAAIEKEKLACKKFANKLDATQRQLEESVQALEAASRLSEQLDAKEEIIANLRSELSKSESQIKSTAQEINSIKSNTDGKVDRVVMKSLVLGYFSTPPGQKSEVIRLLARVLDFNQEEMERAGINVVRQDKVQAQRGILSSLFHRLPSMSSPEKTGHPSDKSFTTLFVQFLENESQPIVPIPFPMDRMTQEVGPTHHAATSMQKGNPLSAAKSPLLLDIDSAFPSFTPVPAIEYSASPAPAILKEVLQ